LAGRGKGWVWLAVMLTAWVAGAPMVLAVDEDFEPPLSYAWESSDPPKDWVHTTERAHSGLYSARSSPYDDSALWVDMTIQSGQISFWYYRTHSSTEEWFRYGYSWVDPDTGSTWTFSKAFRLFGTPGVWHYYEREIDSYIGQSGFYKWTSSFPSYLYIDDVTFPGSAPHTVSTPTTPSGPSTGSAGQSLNYSTGGSSCNQGHAVQYRFDWGDGTYSTWSTATSRSKSWSAAGTYPVKAQARCATDTSVLSYWSAANSVTISPPHTVSTPSAPSGPSVGLAGQSLSYATGGSTCNQGHSVQYRFDWGNGTYSTWSTATSRSKSWSAAGTYQVRAQARCATDTSVVSGWSAAKSVQICVIPSAPTGVNATDGTYGDRVRVTWNAVGGATRYDVYRATALCGTYTKIGESTTTSYDHTGAATLRVYWYKVKGCNACGCSGLSGANSGYAGTPGAGTAAVFRVDAAGNVRADGSFYGQCYYGGSADVAEWVEVSEAVEPGDVLELDPESPGAYRKSRGRCSSLVAGVVSSDPGFVLGSVGDATAPIEADRALLALVGIVPVKACGENGPIALGDLLVAASCAGHVCRWDGRAGEPCTIVGKALEALEGAEGLILVLLTR